MDALLRITGEIELPFPVFSNFNCETVICNGDTNEIIKKMPEADLAYLDPPYNQHPYGSNYFMLNLIVDCKKPVDASKIPGIPKDWNRSMYNKQNKAHEALTKLVGETKAKYIMVSFNSEGFIGVDEMRTILGKAGKVEVLETIYNTFRGSRNLKNREIHVKEYLYLVEK